MKLVFHLSVIIILRAVSSSVICCTESDRAALLAFKSALHERQRGIFDTWAGDDCCGGWLGASCHQETRRVDTITLIGDPDGSIFGQPDLMTGHISPEICKLTALRFFIVRSWTGISGEIPRCISSVSTLSFINLSGNNLSGEIPRDIGRLGKLSGLNLADNSISGRIPGSFTNLVNLTDVQLNGNKLWGRIPRTMGKLSNLREAYLFDNRLTGSIPKSITNISTLRDLDLSNNQLSGPIPAAVGNMSRISTLFLGGNRLSGTIPPGLFASRNINLRLNLSRNLLEGEIWDVFRPNFFRVLIDLSHNLLTGKIPTSLTRTSVAFLDFSYNRLCGMIPTGPTFDSLNASSFIGNDCLCGKPLDPCSEPRFGSCTCM